jgi:hypothetical protein
MTADLSVTPESQLDALDASASLRGQERASLPLSAGGYGDSVPGVV